MDDRRMPTASDGEGWQHGPGALPLDAQGVRCGSCGAHTPVFGTDPVCLYCSMPVELPSDVEERARRVQKNLERARQEAKALDRELASDGMGFVQFIIAAQLVGSVISIAFWVSLLSRAGQSPTPLQLVLLGCSCIGPLLFWAIAQSLRLDADLREAARLAFARLEVQPLPTGAKLRLRCPGCGGELDSSKIRGLIIHCKQCDNPLLAPSALVDTAQRRFLRKALALRSRLERKTLTREVVLCVIGLLYLATFVWTLAVTRTSSEELTMWLVATFFYTFFLSLFWVFTHSYDGWEFFWVAFIWSGLPLAPAMILVFAYLEMTGATAVPR
jgi:hypothetical protein